MIKIEVVLHFNFKEDEVERRGQELLDETRKMFDEAIIEQEFSENCKVMKIELIEDAEEVEPF